MQDHPRTKVEITSPEEESDASLLRRFPFYEEGKVPQYHKYHSKVSYLDELELIWGKSWGAQGIGRLREVAMVRPTETENAGNYTKKIRRFLFLTARPRSATYAGAAPQSCAHLRKARNQGALLVLVGRDSAFRLRAYETQHFGSGRFVINGGAIIPREATPYWRGRSRYVSQFLSDRLSDPLHRSWPRGVRDRGFTPMSEDLLC